ncbi:pyridoxal-phosphate dependent enzyme [Shewanella eurypsychrophilus]|uniref:Pyridoxal-phosphate dependent enzyme n=1 Tax=Shewanella eurypsychrophilus TaxID=2593656 RepID=A0ABX6V4Z3_9GAMM|nr:MULTISPECIES: pyridoxal-phosphate dependent enzyme [Shewanella]QFU22423.1 pyridoxal-phosphate dependent enzyme [Shewanella sp. YLB-09]QPG57710.1 pyridoxal-phosphate dependent enzyme [Shewanella eurypsychrophilus]
MKLSHTQVDTIEMFERQFYLKRDDLLHPDFSGNKARKFAYFLENEFPGVNKLIGYGSPQANSLYSMSALAKLKGWQLDFYVDHIASHINENPVGNYGAALANGANVISLDSVPDRNDRDVLTYIQETILPNEENTVFVPEGGRCAYAEFGVFKLGAEIVQWAQTNKQPELMVFLPSGTGTTALFLNKYFVMQGVNIRVFTCAAVGGDDYLVKQFYELDENEAFHPKVVSLPKKYHFGKLYREFYEMWFTLSQTGIEFELLYDPLGWIALKQYSQEFDSGIPILYLHQGGLLGNETMLPRYERKYGKISRS